jgi:hypothetical protein
VRPSIPVSTAASVRLWHPYRTVINIQTHGVTTLDRSCWGGMRLSVLRCMAWTRMGGLTETLKASSRWFDALMTLELCACMDKLSFCCCHPCNGATVCCDVVVWC